MSATSSPTIRWRNGSETALASGVRAFNAFLVQARSELLAAVAPDAANTSTVVHVVIGNEAADADSIISALVYAHHKRLRAKENGTVVIPVVPVPRDELALRCDVVSLFRELHVDVSALTFVDEFPWRHAAFQDGGRARLEFTLLDHNALSTKRMGGHAVGRVVEILDHHMDLGKHADAAVREIAFADGQALVASTCTLVAEKVLQSRPTEVGADDDGGRHALHATLLLAVIALDSINFDPSAKKVTARDVAAANELEKAACAPKEALFDWLQAAKFSPEHWAAFTVRNCLQCDYKEFELPPTGGSSSSNSGRYGVSAVLIDLERLVTKAESGAAFVAELEAFASANRLAFLVVMTMFVDAEGSRHRQLLFYGAGGDSSAPRTCVAFLEREGSLGLAPLELPASHADRRVQAFSQRNAGASRKQVVPLLQQALEGTSRM
ncbi:hypothetical protein PybrP1_004271 [[Pythium] brassicae (nom. inval.)]|nr:hypothetical protein PybrP1_004271 [[Pythium] brassicae (nom. inval.)]